MQHRKDSFCSADIFWRKLHTESFPLLLLPADSVTTSCWPRAEGDNAITFHYIIITALHEHGENPLHPPQPHPFLSDVMTVHTVHAGSFLIWAVWCTVLGASKVPLKSKGLMRIQSMTVKSCLSQLLSSKREISAFRTADTHRAALS